MAFIMFANIASCSDIVACADSGLQSVATFDCKKQCKLCMMAMDRWGLQELAAGNYLCIFVLSGAHIFQHFLALFLGSCFCKFLVLY